LHLKSSKTHNTPRKTKLKTFKLPQIPPCSGLRKQEHQKEAKLSDVKPTTLKTQIEISTYDPLQQKHAKNNR
jgi:hypothetical protein